ncbi:excinuclease ABC subunit UvrC [bacterium]|nr:excinuclease ABC subunit UvrC [bacterium]
MDLRAKIKRLPLKPGVYLFKNSKGEIIYIGKAIKLKNRVSSYFRGKHSNPKTARLVAKIEDLEFIVVDNEVEALVLEANLVRKHRPHYNVNLKDDKRFPYIHVTEEPYPRIEIVRRKSSSGLYFGPYTDARGMRQTVGLIQKHFRLRSCKNNLPKQAPIRPCLNFDIGRCDAPCQEYVSNDIYSERVDEVILFLKGKKRELVKRLKERMVKLASEEKYEEAADIRDQIKAIDSIWRKQKIDTDLADRDLHAVAIGPRNGIAVTMQVRQGRVISRGEFLLSVSEGTKKSEAMSGYLKQYYQDNPDPPKEILTSVQPDDFNDIAKFVSQCRGNKVKISVPSRGQKKDLIKLVEHNAELLLADLLASKKKIQLPFAIIDLQKYLHLNTPPRTIEAIDISHLSGTCAVASLVSFIDGKKNSRGYRRFRIKTAEGGDDYASIAEVVNRRYARLIEEGKALPDLLLIDGGRGQLNAAKNSLNELEIADQLELASIAKRLEEVFRSEYKNPIMLAKDSPALRLLVKIRDEAHRFAIEYQRKRRTKAYQAQELISIEGIGEIRQKKLLKEFESLEQIASSNPEEISEKTRIPLDLAHKVVEFLSSYKLILVLIALGISILGGCTPSPRYIGSTKPVLAPKKIEQAKKDEDKRVKTKNAKHKEETQKAIQKQNTTQNIKTPSTRFNPDAMLGAVNLYLGTPYKYGGNGLGGVDCSGFTHNVMDAAGIEIPRTSSSQYRQGKPVVKPSAGDLVFFRMRGKGVDHVGVFLGGNRFVHASSSSGVTIDSLDEEYYKKRYLGARRFY